MISPVPRTHAGGRLLRLTIALFAATSAGHVAAEESTCKPLFEAMNRLFTTPSHQYLKQTNANGGAKSTDSEIINTGAALYIRVDGKWHGSNGTGAELQKREEENRKNAKVTTCRIERDEAVDGVAGTLYSAHTETAYGSSDEQLWIAKSSGLPLRETIEIDMVDQGGKSRADIRVVYGAIEAPPVDP